MRVLSEIAEVNHEIVLPSEKLFFCHWGSSMHSTIDTIYNQIVKYFVAQHLLPIISSNQEGLFDVRS